MGSGFQANEQTWHIPDLGEMHEDQLYGDYSNYSLIDMNGDGQVDLVDAEDNNSGDVWVTNGQRYWKVYLNNGTAFSGASIQWAIPDLGEQFDDQLYGDNSNYGLQDLNGDGLMDLIDAEDNLSGEVWTNNGQKYWKVFLNNGTSFQSNSHQWNIPNLGEQFDDQLYGDNGHYGMYDFTGDGIMDLIDAEDNTTGSIWQDNISKYWRVYAGNGSLNSMSNLYTIEDLDVYPNPSQSSVYISGQGKNQPVTIQLLNMSGQILSQYSVSTWPFELVLPTNVGWYIIKATDLFGGCIHNSFRKFSLTNYLIPSSSLKKMNTTAPTQARLTPEHSPILEPL